MRVHARVWVLSLICGVLLAGVVPAAAQASFGVEGFTATNCVEEGCAGVPLDLKIPEFAPYWFPKEPTRQEAIEQGFVQAGGRVPFGVTDFKVNTEGVAKPEEGVPNAKPQGDPVNHVRVDVASGLATSPAAVPTCSLKEFGEKEVAPGTGLYPAPTCDAETEIGKEFVTLYLGENAIAKGLSDLPLEGIVYNLPQPHGLASYYGAALQFPKSVTESLGLPGGPYYAHGFVKGSVEWGEEAKSPSEARKGDYHDYFEVEVSTAFPLISSRQVLYGKSGENEDFITNATNCPGDNTTFVTLENEAKEVKTKKYTTPLGLIGCNIPAEKATIEKLEEEGEEQGEEEGLQGGLAIKEVPFSPEFLVTAGSSLADSPDQITTEALVKNEGKGVSQSQVKTASITLPEGMTLNPSAAAGLEACTPAQAHIHSSTFGVECPVGSEVGTVTLNVPTLPDGSFTGTAYLGGPESGPITAPPYTLYVVANSERYGVSVRVKAEVIPNPVTGQITTVFNENPEQPFTNLKVTLNRGVLTSIANPLVCGTPAGSATFNPVTGYSPTSKTSTVNSAFGVPITGCSSSPPPFALTQSTETDTESAGSHTSYSFNLAREDKNGYLKKITTTLPLGLVGAIPAVEPLCTEAQAASVTCPASSKIGTVTVQSGAGSSPYTFYGTAYMTGPYQGAPYGLEIVTPTVAGPFNLGPVVARAKINIDPKTAQVTAESELPTIVGGIPIRLRSIKVNVNRQGFLYNPTNCTTALSTVSALTSTEGALQSGLSSPFTVTGCSNLKLAPKFSASTSSKVSRANGTSLTTTLTGVAGESNIKSVKVTLPKQLPSRDSTLKLACLQATFEAGPAGCPAGSNVGTATVVTPTLPLPMKGNAYFVSHGGAAFPDLDLVLEEGLVKIILVGNTDITNNITTTTFATTPDVPVTSVTVSLPAKSNSAVGGFGDLCRNPLHMPTTITGQNGKVTNLNPVIAVSGCGVKVVGHKVIGKTAYLTIQTFAPGRISGSGSGVTTVARTLSAATRSATLKVPLSRSGRGKRKPLKVKIRVGFLPKGKGAHSTATVSVTFR